MIFGKYAAIAGAVAIGAIWPFATGQIGQSLYEQEIESMKSPYLTVETESYDRGYLSSDVVTRLSLTGEMKALYESEGLPSSYTILSHVEHGLLGVSSISTLGMTPELTSLTEKLWQGDESPLTIVSETSLFGDTQLDVTVRAMDGDNEDFKITSSPANISGTVDKDRNIVFEMEMPNLTIVSPEDETLSFNEITGSGQGKMVDEMWVGVQQFNISKSAFTIDGETIDIANLGVNAKNVVVTTDGSDVATATKDALRIDSINTLSFQEIDVPNILSLQNFKFGMNLLKLDYQSLITLATMSDAMGEEPSEEDVNKLVTVLDTLVEKGLTFEILPLEMDTPEGNVNARFDLTIEPGLGSVTQNITLLTSKLKGNLFVNVPAAYVNGVPEISASIANLEPYGFISETADGMTLTAKIEGDQAVSPSGQRVPIGLLMMMFM
ncbi:DUF945 family protein [Enterovibrio paralichthyis]|uniref:DUF945 family protein n=1 Tax=Enterovibrio paralichthyis TaxID=2853805 RepID=UPI001C48923E|nr:DUF945 family protein [Enterovibrio paralichthyis]MBV7299253.1 YdgA family protein [Enterovibrio paralichthyis]